MQEMDPRKLAAEIAELKQAVRDLQLAGRLAHSSVEGGPTEVYDDDDTLRQVVGLQEDGSYTARDYNAPAPHSPNVPSVFVSPGLLTVNSWGFPSDGSDWPLDFDHLNIHIGTSEGFTVSIATKVGEFNQDGGVMAFALDPGDYWVALTAVNTSGAESGVAGYNGPNTVAAAETGSGGIATYHSDTEPVGLDFADTGALWYETDNGNLAHRWNGTAWISLAVGTGGIEPGAVTQDRLQVGALDAFEINSPIINGGDITGANFSTDDGTPGTAHWHITSVSGNNNKITGVTGYVIGGVARDAEINVQTSPDAGDGYGRSGDLQLLAPIVGDYGSAAEGKHPRTMLLLSNTEFDPGSGAQLSAMVVEANRVSFRTGFNGGGGPGYVEFDPTVYFHDTATFYEFVDMLGDADVDGNLEVGGTLTTVGATALQGGVTVTGDADVSGTLTAGAIEAPIPFSSRYMAGALATTHGDWVQCSFGTDTETTGIDFAGGVWTITRAGIYLVNATVQFQQDTSGRRLLRMMHNGVEVARSEQQPAGATTDWSLDVTRPRRCAVGDTFEFLVYQSSGVTLDTVAGENFCHAELAYLGA